eukprot:2718453-Amphidinium_carterae.1
MDWSMMMGTTLQSCAFFVMLDKDSEQTGQLSSSICSICSSPPGQNIERDSIQYVQSLPSLERLNRLKMAAALFKILSRGDQHIEHIEDEVGGPGQQGSLTPEGLN